MKKFLKVFYIVFFILALVSSKASAAPTYVDVFSIENEEGHVHGLTFSSDGTVVYIVGYVKDVKGFDVKVSSNYSMVSQIPDYGANLEISNKF